MHIAERILKAYNKKFISLIPKPKGPMLFEKKREQHVTTLCVACREGVCVYNFKEKDIFTECKDLQKIFEDQQKRNLLKACSEAQEVMLHGMMMYALK